MGVVFSWIREIYYFELLLPVANIRLFTKLSSAVRLIFCEIWKEYEVQAGMHDKIFRKYLSINDIDRYSLKNYKTEAYLVIFLNIFEELGFVVHSLLNTYHNLTPLSKCLGDYF